MNKHPIIFWGVLVFYFTILTNSNLTAQNADFLEQKVGHVYHVSIPNYMTRSFSLNEAASLQYLNAAKETYVIVIEDAKEQLLEAGITFKDPEDFYDHFEKSFTDRSSAIGSKKSIKINSYPAFQVEITKPFGGYKVHYLVTVIESDTYFYKMLAWTIEDFKDQYLSDFKRIASSFREGS